MSPASWAALLLPLLLLSVPLAAEEASVEAGLGCSREAEDGLGMLQVATEEGLDVGLPAAADCKGKLPPSPPLIPFEGRAVFPPAPFTWLGGSAVTLWGAMPNSGCSPQVVVAHDGVLIENALVCNHKAQQGLESPGQLFTWIDAGVEGSTHYFALQASNGRYCGASEADGLLRCDRTTVGRCEKFTFDLQLQKNTGRVSLTSPCKQDSCNLAYDRVVRCERSKGDAGPFDLSCESCRSQCVDTALSPQAQHVSNLEGSMQRDGRGWPSRSCEWYSRRGWCFGGGVAPCKQQKVESEWGNPAEHCCACGGGEETPSSVQPFRPPGYAPLPIDRAPWEGSKTCPAEVGASPALRGPDGLADQGTLSFMAGSKVALWGEAYVPNAGCAFQDPSQGEVRCEWPVLPALQTRRQLFTFLEAGSQNFTVSSGSFEVRFFALQASNGMYCGVDADPSAGLPGGVLRCNKKTVGPCEKFRLTSYVFGLVAAVESQCDSGDFRPGFCEVSFSRQIECSRGTSTSLAMTCESQCRTECEDATPGGEEWASGDDCRSQGFTADEGCSERGWTCDAYRQKGWCYGGSVAPCFTDLAGEAHGHPEANCCICGGGGEGVGQPNPSPVRPLGFSPLDPIKPEKCGEDGKTCPAKAEPSPPLTNRSVPLETGELKLIGGSVIAMWTQIETPLGTVFRGCSLDVHRGAVVDCGNASATAVDLVEQRFILVDAGVYGGRRWFALQGSNGMYCGVGDDPSLAEAAGAMVCNKKTIGNCDLFSLELFYPAFKLNSLCNNPDFFPGFCGVDGSGSTLACAQYSETNMGMSCEANCGTECQDSSAPGARILPDQDTSSAGTGEWGNGEGCTSQGYGEEDGCGEQGWTCEGYRKQGWCLGGSVTPCSADKAGAPFNNPEEFCCICGGGEKSGEQVPPFRPFR